eukprot:4432164-Lingulodinium_polyedra.AAC.1
MRCCRAPTSNQSPVGVRVFFLSSLFWVGRLVGALTLSSFGRLGNTTRWQIIWLMFQWMPRAIGIGKP